MKTRFILALALIALAGACATTSPAPPAVPQDDDRYLIHPATGYPGTVPPAVERRLDDAWNLYLARDYTEARRELAEIERRAPGSGPATLLGAAIELREGRPAVARNIVDRLLQQNPRYTAARVYEAEIAIANGDTRRAYEAYRSLSNDPAVPSAATRLAVVRQSLFDQLYSEARTAPDAEAVRLLREALEIAPADAGARILLAQKLVAASQWDEARASLDPLLNTSDVDRNDIQEVLAEIDFGRGRYEDAMARYERLARRSGDARHAQRLQEVKRRWQVANMPPRYRAARESVALTRAELAVLVYWHVESVRFARNLSSPPIAVDVADVSGRDELIRAIAVGLYEVDPVTRRVSPFRPVTAASLTRLAARLLTVRGAACARLPYEPNETLRAQRIVGACGVTDALATIGPEDPVTGEQAVAILEQVDRAIGH